MRDIATSEDIKLFVDTFYQRALQDAEIGYLFTDVAQMDLAKHAPHIYAFWESLLFRAHTYSGNVMQKHIDLHHQEALTEAHFARWLALFNETIDELFAGPRADETKRRAANIATAIHTRINKPQRATKHTITR
jgi:hemoglobin